MFRLKDHIFKKKQLLSCKSRTQSVRAAGQCAKVGWTSEGKLKHVVRYEAAGGIFGFWLQSH